MNIKKLRVFKRIRAYRGELVSCKDQLIAKRKRIDDLHNDLNKSVGENIRNHKKYKDALVFAEETEKRRREFISRLEQKVPDEILNGGFDMYKFWLAESFIVEKYTVYKGQKLDKVYIDNISAMKGFSKLDWEKYEAMEKERKKKIT